MSIKKKLDELEEKLKINNWLPDYTINKTIFRVALIIILILFFISLLITKGDISPEFYYASCERDICDNPFHTVCDRSSEFYDQALCEKIPANISSQPYLLRGESIGEDLHWFVKDFSLIVIFVVLGAFVINHLLYNKEKRIMGE